MPSSFFFLFFFGRACACISFNISSVFRTKLLFPCIVAVNFIKPIHFILKSFRASHERYFGPVRAPQLSCHTTPPRRELRDKTEEGPRSTGLARTEIALQLFMHIS